MENLLTSYLYTHRNCPLPTIGTLLIQQENAVADHSEKKMSAPAPFIQFVSKETGTDALLQYISGKKNIDIQQASDLLSNYCDQLQEMQPYQEVALGNAGNFLINEEGELRFRTSVLPAAFFPAVPAERVIHPDASHNMLVGDTQTNTTAMAGLLDNQYSKSRPKWIWAAAGLGLAGLLALGIYLANRAPGQGFGNSSGIQAPEAPATYQSPGK